MTDKKDAGFENPLELPTPALYSNSFNVGPFYTENQMHEYSEKVATWRVAAWAARENGQWWPIETAPKNGDKIILACVQGKNNFITIGEFCNLYKTWVDYSGEPFRHSYWGEYEVTPILWMPLPRLVKNQMNEKN